MLLMCILGLVGWTWQLTPQRLESFPLPPVANEQIENIRKIDSYTDIEGLRTYARHLAVNHDAKVYERDMATMRSSTLLGVTILVLVVALVILFFEIATRGRTAVK